MAEDYTVQDGDCISSIAYSRGFFWKTVWNDPSNARLKSKRKNPNVLLAGDVVHIPDLTIKQESGATETKHQFKLKAVPEKLHIKLLDYNHKPRPNVKYKILIEGKWKNGTTDSNGMITESIPPDATTGKLVYPAPPLVDGTGKPLPGRPKDLVMILQLGNLNPISEVSGLKARLANLGFYKGPIDEKLDGATKRAINAFQTKQGLPVTGAADDATRQKLQDLHGH
jgi:hypothetical protein